MACYDVNTLTASGGGELSVNLYAEGGLYANVNGISLRPASFHVSRTTNQTLTTGTAQKVQFATESFDIGSDYDAVTNFVFTAPITGIYHFDAQVQIDASGTTTWCQIVKNSTVVAQDIRWNNAVTDDMSAGTSITINLTAADTVEVRALHDAGADRALLGVNVGSCYFSGYFVGLS